MSCTVQNWRAKIRRSVKPDLRLEDRVYSCDCGLVIDRDLNAALSLNRYSC